MDIKKVLMLCKNLNYPNKSLLAKYFDFITFVADIDEFYQANDEFFSEIKYHKQYHEFYEFLQTNIFNVIDEPILNVIDEPILDAIPAPKETKELNKKKRKSSKNKQKQQQPKIKYRRYGTPIEHNFFDEFYQGLYQNCWQDYGYQNDLGNAYIPLDNWYVNHDNW